MQEQTLRTLAASPFNKVRFFVLPKREPANTRQTLYPFEAAGQGFDMTRFNPEFFRHFERRILDLHKAGHRGGPYPVPSLRRGRDGFLTA